MRLNYWYEPTPLNCASSCILYSRWPPGVSSAKQNTWCSTKIDLLQAARGQRSSRLRIQIMNSKQQLLSEPVGWRQPIIGHLLESANEAHIVTSFAPPNSYWNFTFEKGTLVYLPFWGGYFYSSQLLALFSSSFFFSIATSNHVYALGKYKCKKKKGSQKWLQIQDTGWEGEGSAN